MNIRPITHVTQIVALYTAGIATAAAVSLVGIPAVASAVTSEPTQAVQIEEDDPSWNWAADGNTCRGIGNGAVECVDPARFHPLTAGVWTHIEESRTWVFCPASRSDIECGA